MIPSPIAPWIKAQDWKSIEVHLNQSGYATLPNLLKEKECTDLINLYEQDSLFRNRIIMQRHGFGEGEYRYFTYPLPSIIHDLRTSIYPHLAPIANQWRKAFNQEEAFPSKHADYLRICHLAGQVKPTPLLLKYGQGDYNRSHQDLYGDLHFPLQMAVLLSKPGTDFTGGEFVLTEQKPRTQSRVEVVPIRQGEAVIFAVNHRPGQGQRGVYRLTLRHGVSCIRSGQRYCLGIIFHDAT